MYWLYFMSNWSTNTRKEQNNVYKVTEIMSNM